MVRTILSDRTGAARLLPKFHGLLLNPKGILPGVGEKLAPPWFGGGSHGPPQLPPCAGVTPHGKSSGCSIISPACPGPSSLRARGVSLADGEAVLWLGEVVLGTGEAVLGVGEAV